MDIAQLQEAFLHFQASMKCISPIAYLLAPKSKKSYSEV